MINLEQIEQEVKSQGGRALAIFTYENGDKAKKRLGISSYGGVMVFRKYAKRYGYDIRNVLRGVVNIRIQKPRYSKAEKWQRSWKKVIAKLQKSGLWKLALEDYKLGLEIGYEKIQEAYKAYWEEYENAAERVLAVDSRLVGYTDTEENEKPYVKTQILWYMYRSAKIKKMYFGKYNNQRYLEQIKEAMESKTSCHVCARASYDVSFEYKPESNRAWYSEEYRNCGNGHYYLALDATHALFYEDD